MTERRQGQKRREGSIMSYHEAARKVRMQAVEKIEMPKEKLYESPWIPEESTRAENVAVNLSYYAVARKVKEQKEILYDSPWVSRERARAGNAKAWIQQLKFFDRWLFLVTGIVRGRLSRS
jgi:hypothetical protein